MPMGFWSRAIANINGVSKQILVKIFFIWLGFFKVCRENTIVQIKKKKKSQRREKKIPKFDPHSLRLEPLVFV